MALYIQRSRALRIHRPGKPDLISERPVDRKGNYADTAKPTLIELGPDCAVDPARLLKIGAIEAYMPPVAEKPKEKEVTSGKATS
jgi:hypothetical protein